MGVERFGCDMGWYLRHPKMRTLVKRVDQTLDLKQSGLEESVRSPGREVKYSAVQNVTHRLPRQLKELTAKPGGLNWIPGALRLKRENGLP